METPHRAAPSVNAPGWTLERTASGLPFLRCEALSRSGLAHAFTLRAPGVTAVPHDRRPLEECAAAIGLAGRGVARPRQVHGAVVAIPGGAGGAAYGGAGNGGTEPERADAVLVTARVGAAAIATADCMGAILLEPDSGGFAVIHAGWRGTLAGVVDASIAALARESGRPASAMILATGPAVGGCCYAVGPEVVAAFRDALPPSVWPAVHSRRDEGETIDITAVNRHRAERAGVRAENIHAAGVCTICRADLCWSWRAHGAAAGRMWTLAGRAPLPAPA